jgi:gliding motility-associated-like protein
MIQRLLWQCRTGWQYVFLVVIWFSVGICPASAQGETDWWHFNGAALHFTAAGPVQVPALIQGWDSEEGSASVSDAAGNLLFYTDGSTIWTRRNQPMPGGTGLGLSLQYSSTQGSLIVPDPADAQRYYVFRQAAYGYLPYGLGYVVVDLRLNSGLGAVTGPMTPLSPPNLQFAEKLTAITHENGRDVWVLTHGVRSNIYYAFLVTAAGINPTPVSTSIGSVHGPAPGGFGPAGSAGYLKASPNGTKVAVAVTRYGLVELLDFDAATGQLSNPVRMNSLPDAYGVEFSADGSKLYASTAEDRSIHQYDLLAGTAAAIIRSDVVVGRSSRALYGDAGALQRGPDGRIYLAQKDSYLGCITRPELSGTACAYQEQAVQISAVYGLPSFPNSLPAPGRRFLRIAATVGCLTDSVRFTGRVTPMAAPSGSRYVWEFGEPGSGSANVSTRSAPAHKYLAGGTYVVRLRLESATGQVVASTTELVSVSAPPAVSLAPQRRVLCLGDSLLLNVAPVAGVQYRWQDGTAGPMYRVRRPGTYRVQAISAQGCVATDSVEVSAAQLPQVSLGPDTIVCATAPPVVLRPSAQPAGTTYRWQDGSTQADYTARQAGIYWVEVRNTNGCQTRAQIRVQWQECPALIPNIITPNGDGRNDTWVLQGLNPTEWALTIYSRWGLLVYQTTAYDNEWQALGLPTGVYYYRLQHRTTAQQYRGWVEVAL